MDYKTGEGRQLRRSNVEHGLGVLEQGLGRDGNLGAVVKRRAYYISDKVHFGSQGWPRDY